MAFAQSVRRGQFPMVCQLCESETKIKYKCMDCSLLICNKCKERVHPKFKTTKEHRIIDIKEVGAHSGDFVDTMDFNNIECKQHPNLACCLFCQNCNHLVCPSCISVTHNGHKLVEIADEYEKKLKILQDGKQKIMNSVDELCGEKIEQIKTDQNVNYSYAKKGILSQKSALKSAVDKYADKLEYELDQKWKTFQDATGERQLAEKIEHLFEENKRAEEVIQCKDAKKFFEDEDQLLKSIDEAIRTADLVNILIPKFVPGKINLENFGTLQQQIKVDVKFAIAKRINPGLSYINLMAMCSDGSLWLSDTVDSTGLNRIFLEEGGPVSRLKIKVRVNSIAVMPSNDLLLASNDSVIKQVDGITGKIKDSVYDVTPLETRVVTITQNKKVIVAAMEFGTAFHFPVTGKRVVIMMNMEGEHEAIYEYDEFKNNLFTMPYDIVSTCNNNICIIDLHTKGARGRVVVIEQGGSVKNIYTGHPDINSNKEMTPVGLATTKLDNIIVSDMNNHALHILNNLGQVLAHVKTLDARFPYCMAFNNAGKLFLGCSAPIGKSDKVKLYEVDFSGC